MVYGIWQPEKPTSMYILVEYIPNASYASLLLLRLL